MKKIIFSMIMLVALVVTTTIANAQSASTPTGVPEGAKYQYTLALKSVDGCSYDVYAVGDQVYHVCRKTVDGREVFEKREPIAPPKLDQSTTSVLPYPNVNEGLWGSDSKVIMIIIPDNNNRDNDPHWPLGSYTRAW